MAMLTLAGLAAQRLRNQRLAGPGFTDAGQAVGWLGAVQAQDYPGAKWALSQRTNGLADAVLEDAFTRGEILRTHLMRPTWHFVTPADIGWIQALTAPRVQAINASYYRREGLDARVMARSHRVMARALEGGRYLTRAELSAVLERAGVQAVGFRLSLVVMHAELERVICSGPRRGKQFTYALFEERAPATAVRPREEALAELARRYFTSHGPATIRDFVWWSGLRVADAKAAVQLAGAHLASAGLDDRTYWFAADAPPAAVTAKPSTVVHLLPNYDEYFIAYKDRHLVRARPGVVETIPRVPDIFAHQIAVDGVLAGSWSRTPGTVMNVAVSPYGTFSRSEARGLAEAVRRYAAFLGSEVRLSVTERAEDAEK